MIKNQKRPTKSRPLPPPSKRKHEASKSDLIKSTILLIAVAIGLLAIPFTLWPYTAKLMVSDYEQTTALVKGYAGIRCRKTLEGKNNCLGPIFEFQDKRGNVIRAIGIEDQQKRLEALNQNDPVPIVYLENQTSVVVSSDGFLQGTAAFYLIGMIDLLMIVTHFYICALNYKYRRDDERL